MALGGFQSFGNIWESVIHHFESSITADTRRGGCEPSATFGSRPPLIGWESRLASGTPHLEGAPRRHTTSTRCHISFPSQPHPISFTFTTFTAGNTGPEVHLKSAAWCGIQSDGECSHLEGDTQRICRLMPRQRDTASLETRLDDLRSSLFHFKIPPHWLPFPLFIMNATKKVIPHLNVPKLQWSPTLAQLSPCPLDFVDACIGFRDSNT